MSSFMNKMTGLLIDGKDNYSSVLGSGWKGKRLLGRGDNGVVGLWEYEGPEAYAVLQVAVKQSHTVGWANPLRESQIMASLSEAKSLHIVRQYRDGVSMRVEGGGVIVAMFLEFCPAGDLLRFEGRGDKILEVDLWEIFLCLASANSVIDRGTEDVNSGRVLYGNHGKTLVHYDMKPDNVFLGRRDPNHTRYPILKLGDFGQSIYEPKNPPNKDAHGEPRLRGAEGFRAPENLDRSPLRLQSPRKGACSNTWQLGLIMHAVMRRATTFPSMNGPRLLKAPFTKPEYESKYTVGNDLLGPPWNGLYSLNLRELIMECLMWEPDDRPETLDLQKRVLEGLRVAREVAEREGLLEGDKNPTIRNFEDVEPGYGWWEHFQ